MLWKYHQRSVTRLTRNAGVSPPLESGSVGRRRFCNIAYSLACLSLLSALCEVSDRDDAGQPLASIQNHDATDFAIGHVVGDFLRRLIVITPIQVFGHHLSGGAACGILAIGDRTQNDVAIGDGPEKPIVVADGNEADVEGFHDSSNLLDVGVRRNALDMWRHQF